MKVAIVLHLYYIDLWEEFRDRLSNIDLEFDLYVSLCINNKDISDDILKDFPSAKIFHVPNKGLDIGPFLLMLDYFQTNNKNYDYIVKVHGKKSVYQKTKNLGFMWRTYLLDNILGKGAHLKNLLENMSINNYNIAIPEQFIYEEKDTAWMDDLLEAFELTNTGVNKFAAGSMFIVRYSSLIDFFKKFDILSLYNLTSTSYILHGGVEHKLERILSFVPQIENNKIYEIK